MKAWLFNAYQLKCEGSDVQILSVFLAESTIDGNELESELVSELAKLGPIHAVHFVGLPDAVDALRELLASPASVLMDRLNSVVGHLRDSMLFVSLDATSGQHTCEDALALPSQTRGGD